MEIGLYHVLLPMVASLSGLRSFVLCCALSMRSLWPSAYQDGALAQIIKSIGNPQGVKTQKLGEAWDVVK